MNVSFWAANRMPVYIEQPLGYYSDKVSIRGGTRTYNYFRIGPVGIEVTLTEDTT